jgi:hypothetical protein
MRLGHHDGTHLDQPDADTTARELIRRLTAGKAGSDHGYLMFSHRESFSRPGRKSVEAAKREEVIVAVFRVPVNRRRCAKN